MHVANQRERACSHLRPVEAIEQRHNLFTRCLECLSLQAKYTLARRKLVARAASRQEKARLLRFTLEL
jgi:hypothetical protein